MRWTSYVIAAIAGGVVVGLAQGWTIQNGYACKFDGMMFWTAAGCVVGALTALAAIYGSYQARTIANRQIAEATRREHATARSYSVYVSNELRWLETQLQVDVMMMERMPAELRSSRTWLKYAAVIIIPDVPQTTQYATVLDVRFDTEVFAKVVADVGYAKDALKQPSAVLEAMMDPEILSSHFMNACNFTKLALDSVGRAKALLNSAP